MLLIFGLSVLFYRHPGAFVTGSPLVVGSATLVMVRHRATPEPAEGSVARDATLLMVKGVEALHDGLDELGPPFDRLRMTRSLVQDDEACRSG
jgi:hypothetical protein